MKPFSQACQNNRDPILAVLRRVFSDRRRVLEIGSGTGQHAVYFARHLPHLQWYTSDLQENHEGILQWMAEYPLENLHSPRELDVSASDWGVAPVDAVFSANTVHIMSWSMVGKLFAGLGHTLLPGGVFALYGPFNYNGEYTSESNQRFDIWLKAQEEHRGIRDFEKVDKLAREIGLELVEDNTMPANNRLLVWRRA
ncbi:MAG: DUF938 domain-containing protein [Exilibacterium sp.]